MQEINSFIDQNFENFIQDLVDLSKIPSISSDPKEKDSMFQCVSLILKKLLDLGFEDQEMIELEGAPPYIFAQKIVDPSLPTLLLYSHYDVQPVGNLDFWHNHPFEPALRDGRLFGRGCVDDKAGFIQHYAAIRAVASLGKPLPLNIKFLIEGEEEIGSEHLGQFLDLYQEKLSADLLLLTDTANLELGLPSITYRLRGIADLELKVKVLEHPVHSGMWGGPVTDALTLLCKLLASMTDAQGKILVPGFYDDVLEISDLEKSRLEKLPFDEDQFRRDLSSVASLEWSGEEGYSVYEKIWSRPTVSVVAIDAPQTQSATNRIVEEAKAKISIRTVNDQDPKRILQLFKEYFEQQFALGAEVKVTLGSAGPSWKSEASGRYFAAMEQSLRAAYEKDPIYIGCGGSIPFVNTLSEKLGGIPAVLIGLEDPLCKAHAENESVDLSDLKKGMKALAYFIQSFS